MSGILLSYRHLAQFKTKSYLCHSLFRSTVQNIMPKRQASTEASASKKSPAKKSKKTAKSKTVDKEDIPREKVGKKDLVIISTNVAGLRGLLNNEKRKKTFLDMVETESPDLLGLQEHKLQDIHVESIGEEMKKLLPEYEQFWTCSGPPQKKGYAGVAMFVRTKTKKKKQQSLTAMFGGKSKSGKGTDSAKKSATVLNVTYGLGEKYESDAIATKEGRVVTVELPSLYVVNAYVPNSGQKLDRLDYRVNTWDKSFGNYLKSLEGKGKPVLLVGDLNVAHQIIDTHNYYVRPWFPDLPEGENEYQGLKQLQKQAGCTAEERASFTELLSTHDFVDTFRHFNPNALGQFSYWSVRAGNRPVNRGLRLDYAIPLTGKNRTGDGDGGGQFNFSFGTRF